MAEHPSSELMEYLSALTRAINEDSISYENPPIRDQPISGSSSTTTLRDLAQSSIPFASQLQNWAHESIKTERIFLGLSDGEGNSKNDLLHWDLGRIVNLEHRDSDNVELDSGIILRSLLSLPDHEEETQQAGSTTTSHVDQGLGAPKDDTIKSTAQSYPEFLEDDTSEDEETLSSHPWTSVRETATIVTAPTDISGKGSVAGGAGIETDDLRSDDGAREQTLRSHPKDFPTIEITSPDVPGSTNIWPYREDDSSGAEDEESDGIESLVEDIEEDESMYTSNGDPCSRLSDPQKYFDGLESLEREIYQLSALKAHGDRRSLPLTSITESMFLELEESLPIRGSCLYPKFKQACEIGEVLEAAKVWFLLDCFCTMWVSSINLAMLKDNHYCDASINLLSLDTKDRRRNCVRLVSISYVEIARLVGAFEQAVLKIESSATIREPFFSQATADLTTLCESFLRKVRLWDPASFPASNSILIWGSTVHVLDLALLSYSGAHLEPFDERYHVGQTEFKIPYPPTIKSHPEDFLRWLPQTIVCRRRSLQCLDAFLRGQRVWVFELEMFADAGEERLHLVSDVDTFADIWGPMFKECTITRPEEIVRYRVGHGHIVPWISPSGFELEPGERFCHWTDSTEGHLASSQSFKGSDTLVIGAPHVVLNPKCCCSNWKIKQHLQEKGLIQPLNTSDPAMYVDSETLEVQAGVPAKGLVGKYGRTWKRRESHFQRAALLEAWEHPELGQLDPAALEHRDGLELSLSTHNSRKIPLIRLLGSPSMLEYLRPFQWLSDECKNAYVNAVTDRDLRAFRRLWYDLALKADQRDNIRKAVCCCLNALSETGVGIKEEPNTLYIIWVPAPGQRHLVLLKQPQHKWSRFLKESKAHFTMAVVTKKCLEFPYDGGRSCLSTGVTYSVFETALIISEAIKPEELRKMRLKNSMGVEEHCWSVSQLRSGTSFPLGDRGAFSFIKRIGKGSALMAWGPAFLQQAKAKVIEEIFKKQTLRHLEYIQDDTELDHRTNGVNSTSSAPPWSGSGTSVSKKGKPRVKPLRVFLTSNYSDNEKDIDIYSE